MRNRAMIIDGVTYVMIAFFGAVTAALSTDEAYKFIDEARLFYMRSASTSIGAALLALKMFRSTSFSDALWDTKKAAEKSESVTSTFSTTVTQKPSEDKSTEVKKGHE